MEASAALLFQLCGGLLGFTIPLDSITASLHLAGRKLAKSKAIHCLVVLYLHLAGRKLAKPKAILCLAALCLHLAGRRLAKLKAILCLVAFWLATLLLICTILSCLCFRKIPWLVSPWQCLSTVTDEV